MVAGMQNESHGGFGCWLSFLLVITLFIDQDYHHSLNSYWDEQGADDDDHDKDCCILQRQYLSVTLKISFSGN